MAKNSIFQNDFVSSITREINIESVLQQIVPVGVLSKSQVLDVYRGDYFARLTGALGENFEALWAVLGDEEFFSLSRQYIKKYPSCASDLGELGHQLPSFLKENGYEEGYPFICDLAAFEIDFWKTFHSAKRLNSHLQQPSFEVLVEATIEFREDLKWYAWDYRIKDIWSYRELGFENVKVDFHLEQCVLMFRGDNNVMMLELTNSQMKLFQKLKAGSSLSAALDDVEIQANDLQVLFTQLELHGLIENYFLV